LETAASSRASVSEVRDPIFVSMLGNVPRTLGPGLRRDDTAASSRASAREARDPRNMVEETMSATWVPAYAGTT